MKAAPNKSPLKDRFPGLRSFEREDAALFFGRDAELAQLCKFLQVHRISLIFGASGVGKTSLLNTAFKKLPELASMLPVKIRLNPLSNIDDERRHGISPLQIAIKRLTKKLKNNGIILDKNKVLFDRQHPKLWETVKLAELMLSERAAGTRQEDEAGVLKNTLVIIFDQFEEFFLYPRKTQINFIKQVAEICHPMPPKRILDWAGTLPDKDRTHEILKWYKQPEIRIVFSIRSDKLSLINGIIGYISPILQNRMEVRPFQQNNAILAIKGPAALPNDEGKYNSPPFKIDESIITQVVRDLSNGFNEIESSFLQIICYYMEQKVLSIVRERQLGATKTYHFNAAQFKEEIDINTILDKFYQDQLDKIENVADRNLACKAIEDELVSDGQRTSLLHAQLLRKLNNNESLIDYLLDARLIREENTPRGVTLELSHDKLIAAVEKSKSLRVQKERLDEENQERERKLLAEAAQQQKELAHQKELVALKTKLTEDAEAQRQIAIEERDRAEQARTIALEEKHRAEQAREDAVIATRKAQKRKRFALGSAVLCGISVLLFFWIFVLSRRKNYDNLNTQAENFYLQNDHGMAFNLWYNYIGHPLFNNKSDSIKTMLNHRFLFDISGGDDIQAMRNERFAVHYWDNRIIIWSAGTDKTGVKPEPLLDSNGKVLKSGVNLLTSDDGLHIAYRNTADNRIYVYNDSTKTTHSIPGSRLSPSVSGKVSAASNLVDGNLTDYKMDFLSNNDFIAYINLNGDIHLFNLKQNQEVPLVVVKRSQDFYTSDIKKMFLLSSDGSYLLVKRPNTSSANIRKLSGGASYVTKTITNVDKIYPLHDPDRLLIRFNDARLATCSYRDDHKITTRPIADQIDDMLLSPDGSKALLLKKNKQLLLYDFKLNRFDVRFQGNKTLKKLNLGADAPLLRAIVRWTDTGNKFAVTDKNGRVLLVDLVNVESFFLLETINAFPGLLTTDGAPYLLSHDGKRCMYVDTTGMLKIVDVPAGKVSNELQLFQKTDKDLFIQYNLNDIVQFNQDATKVAVIRREEKNKITAGIYDLKTDTAKTIGSARYLGHIFTNKYIQFIYDSNNAGGIMLLNYQQRNIEYYRKAFPLFTAEQKEYFSTDPFK